MLVLSYIGVEIVAVLNCSQSERGRKVKTFCQRRINHLTAGFDVLVDLVN
jgi:hypothetical protein